MSKLFRLLEGTAAENWTKCAHTSPDIKLLKLMQMRCCIICKGNWKCAGENRIQVEQVGSSVELIQTKNGEVYSKNLSAT
jgi:hypothetical protein